MAIDPKARLVDGEVVPPPAPPADYVVFLDAADPIRELGRVVTPTSFMGPPSSVVIPRSGRFAVTSATAQVDPKDPAKFASFSRVSLIALRPRPRLVTTLDLGSPPSSLALSADGMLLVAVQGDRDTATVLRVDDTSMRIVQKVTFPVGSRPLAAAFLPGGRRLLVTFSGSNVIGIFDVEGDVIKTPAVREMTAGVHPTAVSICGTSGYAVVANYGAVSGDRDTVSLIDLSPSNPRVVDTISVGASPEGVACSADGRFAAAAVQNMSTVASSNPYYSTDSIVVLLRRDGDRLTRISERRIGGWAQGVGFLDDGRLFAESIMDGTVHLFRIEGTELRETKPLFVATDGGPTGYGLSGR
ncbi:YncE family protein [Sphingomonas sp. UYAg733]